MKIESDKIKNITRDQNISENNEKEYKVKNNK